MKGSRTLRTLILGASLWEIASKIAGGLNFPHSWVVISDFLKLLFTGKFWSQYFQTLEITFLGLLFGTFLAFLVGVIVSANRFIGKSFLRFINFFIAIPSVVFLPIFISSFGANLFTAILIVVLVVFFRMVTFVISGIQNISSDLVEVAKVSKLTVIWRALLIYFPAIFRSLNIGLKYTSTIAFGTVIASGIATGTPGIGSSLLIAESAADTPRVFSYVLISGITGLFIYSISSKLDKLLKHWSYV